MKYLILVLLFLPILVFGQAPFSKSAFPTTADTIANYTSNDTVDVRLRASGGAIGPWNALTESVNDTAYITVDDKLAETTVVFNVSAETWWTHCEALEVRIRGAGDTTGSNFISIGDIANGAVTIWIVPDTLLADTEVDYVKSRVTGN